MKATIFQKSSLALILALTPFLWGCDQQANSATVSDTVAAAPAQPPSDLTAADANEPAGTNEDVLANADGKLISTPDVASTNVSNNPQLTDFVKLVQAGVGESVLMAYVTNSPTPFNLSSDDIVYLNDLGAPETTITAMLQRDQYYNGTAATAPEPTAAPPGGAAPPPMMEQPAIPDQSAMMAQTPPLTPPAEIEAEVQQSPNASYSYFYDSLSPYGNWIDISGYGPCWQPTVVVANPGWQPYCDRGHWAYTDSGWCWVSDYSWGWAPFHYGRWFHNTRFGWCWAPDTVWGPSWVSWRYSDSYCGWAPLPPAACYRPGFGFSYYGHSVGVNFGFGLAINHFTFVPLNHFHDRYPSHYRMEHREVTKIYNTTVVNNTIIRGNNNTIINRGVPVDRVARATHTEIRPIKIRADASAPRTAQLGRDGRTLAVYRPELPKPRPGPAPKFVGEGVQPAPHFDLHSRVEQAHAARENPSRRPAAVSAAPERRPIISNPAQNRPENAARENAARDNRNIRSSQPNTEQPGSLIMRGPNQDRQDRPDRGTVSRGGNTAQTPPSNVRHGPEMMPQQPGQAERGDNNRRVVTPPLRPQDQNVSPVYNRPDNNQSRDDGNQARQQRQLLQQQQQLRQQQEQQFQQQRQQRDFQPVVPTPRQEAPARSFETPRSQPPVRSEPVAPPRTYESRPAPEVRSAPPQPSAPAHESRSDNGGGQRGGGGNSRNDNGNGNDRGNGRNR
jgi:hypothetical protein